MKTSISAKTAVIITAAGSSTRMGASIKKEHLPLKRGTVLSECARAFLTSLAPFCILITVPKNGEKDAFNALFSDGEMQDLIFAAQSKVHFVEGGKTRQESILNAMLFLEKSNAHPEIVLIHDGARPFVSEKIIKDTANAAYEYGASAPGIPPVDTHKLVCNDGFIEEHLTRNKMVAIQTPQAFTFAPLLQAHKKAAQEKTEYTDDTEIWGNYIGKVKIVLGSTANKKITHPEDYNMQNNFVFRTGLGYDIHPLVEGRKLLIGGVDFPFEKGEAGHSDGDALLHAITDALLGASGKEDIGCFFPPEEDKWKDADSSVLLKTAWQKIKNDGWTLNNLDCVIKLEKPKFLPKRDEVILSIANILEVEQDKISVKAKTGERLDSVGRGEAIEAWCSAILIK